MRKQKIAAALLQFQTTNKEPVQASLVGCVNEPGVRKEELLQLLAKSSPLAPSGLSALSELLNRKDVEGDVKLLILERAHDLGMSPQAITDAVLGLLKEYDNTIKTKALPILTAVGPGARSALEPLRGVVADQNNELALRYKAVIAMTAIDHAYFNYQDYFLRELNGDHPEIAQMAMKEMAAPLAVPLLLRALKDVQADRRHLVVSALGSFGEHAKEATKDLQPLLSDDDPLLRYETTLAIVRIDPSEAHLPEALRAQLLGRYRARLLQANLGEDARPVLESLEQNSHTFLERKITRELLKRLQEANQGSSGCSTA